MHTVDMSFQSRNLRATGLRPTAQKWDFFVSQFSVTLVDVYTFRLQLNCQINEERGISITFTQYISYLKNPCPRSFSYTLYFYYYAHCTIGVAKIFRFTCTLFWSIPTYSRTLSRSFSEK